MDSNRYVQSPEFATNERLATKFIEDVLNDARFSDASDPYYAVAKSEYVALLSEVFEAIYLHE
jgi:hypothetical protein